MAFLGNLFCLLVIIYELDEFIDIVKNYRLLLQIFYKGKMFFLEINIKFWKTMIFDYFLRKLSFELLWWKYQAI
jgi:hypothetical protein